MAKRSRSAAPKSSGGVLPLLIGLGVVGAAAILLTSKSANAAPAPAKTPGTIHSGTVNIAVIASGTDPAASPIQIPAFVLDTVNDKGAPLPSSGAQGFLEAFNAAGAPLYGPITAEPSVVTISNPAFVTHDADLGALLANGSFANYTSGPEAAKIVAYGGKVLIWTVTNTHQILKWWLTQWS